LQEMLVIELLLFFTRRKFYYKRDTLRKLSYIIFPGVSFRGV